MPNRIVREGILSSEAVNELDWREECFFRRLLNVVDDWGRYDARAAILRSACYPLAIDRMGVSDVQGCLSRCVALGLVREYEAGGKSYIEVANFRQRTRSTSKYPAPLWQTNDGHMTDKCQTDDSHVSVTCQSNVSHVSDRCQTSARLDGGGDGGVNKVAVVSSSTTVYPEAEARGPAAPAAAAAADGTYEKWREAMCGAFPTLRSVAKLSEKVEAVARDAYERMPGAAEEAELLAAYLDDRTPTDRYRNKFYRPVSQLKFFENLEDVVRHAELWKKEMGWSAAKAKAKKQTKPKDEPEKPPVTEAEKKAFFADLHRMMSPASGVKAQADYQSLARNRKEMTPAEEAEAAAQREAILRRVKGGRA